MAVASRLIPLLGHANVLFLKDNGGDIKSACTKDSLLLLMSVCMLNVGSVTCNVFEISLIYIFSTLCL